jgi:hypothetical protein
MSGLPGSRAILATSLPHITSSVLRTIAVPTSKAGAASTAPAAPEAKPRAKSEDESSSAEDHGPHICPFSGKRFKSRGAFESYTMSKKYKALAAKAAQANACQRAPEKVATDGSSQEASSHACASLRPVEGGPSDPPAPSNSMEGDMTGPGRVGSPSQPTPSSPPSSRHRVCYMHPDGSATIAEVNHSLPEGGTSSSDESDGWEDIDEPWYSAMLFQSAQALMPKRFARKP